MPSPTAARATALALTISLTAPAVAQETKSPTQQPAKDFYKLPNAPKVHPLTDDQQARLTALLDTIRSDHAAGELQVVIANSNDLVFRSPSGEEASDKPIKLGKLSAGLIALVAARLSESNEISLTEPAHTYAPNLFPPEAKRFGRSPSINELLSGMGGVKPIGTSAYDRPLFDPEFMSLFNERPLREYQPGEGGAAATMFILSRHLGQPFPALAASTLAEAGLPPINTPPFGQMSATPKALATIFGTLADRTLLEPTTIEDLAKLQLGTLDRAAAFRSDRIESRQAWTLDLADEAKGLMVRVDLERRLATLVIAPKAEDPEHVFIRTIAAVEAVIPSPRETMSYEPHNEPRTRSRQVFASLDKNADGLVTFEEADIQGTQGAGQGDANADGILTIDEWATTMGSGLLR